MTWFKVDDNLAFHAKTVAAGNPAMGLWVRAGSWCSDQLTEGVIPDHMVKAMGTTKEAQRLVDVRLWERVDGGYRFWQWNEEGRQPTKEAVLADRRAGAARQKVARSPELREAIRLRDGDRCRYCAVAVQWNDRRGPHGGTYDHIDPDGPTDLDNLAVCCRACNAAKGRRTPEQAGMRLIQLGSDADLNRSQVVNLGRTK